MLFLFAFLFAVISADCVNNALTQADITAATAANLCFGTAVGVANPTVDTKATAVCGCISTYAGLASSNCDLTAIQTTTLCSAATILGGIATANYDFGTGCSTCANPPTSPNWPAPCLKCLSQYTACATTGYFNLRTYPSIVASISLAQICGCVGQFYNCFASCGSPLSGYVSSSICSALPMCSCDGSTTVKSGTAVVTYLKQYAFATFHANVLSASGGAILTIDCVTKTTANANALATDRFVCDINFAAVAPNWAQVRTWLNAYFGRNSNVALGVQLSGTVTSLKRLETEEAVTGTYTVVVDNSSFAIGASFSSFILLAVMLFALF